MSYVFGGVLSPLSETPLLYPCLTDREIEVPRGKVHCPKSLSSQLIRGRAIIQAGSIRLLLLLIILL